MLLKICVTDAEPKAPARDLTLPAPLSSPTAVAAQTGHHYLKHLLQRPSFNVFHKRLSEKHADGVPYGRVDTFTCEWCYQVSSVTYDRSADTGKSDERYVGIRMRLCDQILQLPSQLPYYWSSNSTTAFLAFLQSMSPEFVSELRRINTDRIVPVKLSAKNFTIVKTEGTCAEGKEGPRSAFSSSKYRRRVCEN